MKKYCAVIVLLAALLSQGVCFAQDAPKFSLRGLDGKTFKLGGSAGKKMVVLNFWASWCSACAQEIPALKDLQSSPGADKAVFVGVNVGENRGEVKRFVKKYQYPYPVVMDETRKTAKKYGLTRLPTTVVVDTNGKIVFSGPHPPGEEVFVRPK